MELSSNAPLPDSLDTKGYCGLPTWSHHSAAETRLTDVCATVGMHWRYVRDGYTRVHQGPLTAEKGQAPIQNCVYVHVGYCVEGEGSTLAERYMDVANWVRGSFYPTFQFNTTEAQSSDMLGPGLYEVDLLCAELGAYWSLPNGWHHSEEAPPDGSIMIGPLIAFCGNSKEECLHAVAEYITAAAAE